LVKRYETEPSIISLSILIFFSIDIASSMSWFLPFDHKSLACISKSRPEITKWFVWAQRYIHLLFPNRFWNINIFFLLNSSTTFWIIEWGSCCAYTRSTYFTSSKMAEAKKPDMVSIINGASGMKLKHAEVRESTVGARAKVCTQRLLWNSH